MTVRAEASLPFALCILTCYAVAMADTQPKKLTRSSTNKVLGGVCGGIGEYFSVDPVVVRVGWIIFSLCGGSGILAYLIAWVIIPADNAAPTA